MLILCTRSGDRLLQQQITGARTWKWLVTTQTTQTRCRTRLHRSWNETICWANRNAWRGNGCCYPRMKPHTQGSPIRKWEIRAAVHASTRQGPAATRMHTALSFLRAWQHTQTQSLLNALLFVCIFLHLCNQWSKIIPKALVARMWEPVSLQYCSTD